MQYKFLFAVAAAVPLVAAHGKISVVQGDAGGNGTALAIQGGIVPGAGANKETEVDTTVFRSTKIATNGLGHTTGKGKNKVAMIAQAMALSGSTLPQVSANGGSISGTFHIVTTDGAGPLKAVIDPTATGKFAKGTAAQVVQQVPGKNGNIRPNGSVKQRSITGRALVKRAANVDRDFPMKIEIPAGTTCSGKVAGLTNVCLLKVANSNPAGPFGGVIAFQIANSGAAAAAGSATATTATPVDAREVEAEAESEVEEDEE